MFRLKLKCNFKKFNVLYFLLIIYNLALCSYISSHSLFNFNHLFSSIYFSFMNKLVVLYPYVNLVFCAYTIHTI